MLFMPFEKSENFEYAESVMCDVIKIRLLSISFLGISFPTLPLILSYAYLYDVTHYTFRISPQKMAGIMSAAEP